MSTIVRGAASPAPVILTASDGVRVFGWHYPGPDARKPVILLFHQAGSNHAEYSTIAPRLVSMGYPCLAIDQRSGGRMWGVKNRTADTLGKDVEYLSALPDLEAALDWSRSQNLDGRPIVWGSSYSAALVFVLAAKREKDIAAVLAFSPGEYLGEPHMVEAAAANVHVPVFVDCAKDEGEISVARTIALAAHGTQFIPKVAGIHGSSTLRLDKNPKGAAENWQAVQDFLEKAASS